MPEVVVEFDLSFSDNWRRRLAIIRELESRQLSHVADFDAISQLVNSIVACYETLSGQQRTRADGALTKLVRLLDIEERRKRGLEFIKHRRRSHRQVGYAALTGLVDDEVIGALLLAFEQYRDTSALECIARSDNEFSVSAYAEYVLQHLENEYLKARIIQRLLSEDPAKAIQLSSEHETAFVWAAGRAQANMMLNTVLEILSRNPTNYDLLSLIAWALGRLGAISELDELDKQLDQLSS